MDSVVILAKGDYPTHPITLRILKDAKTIICCDGAVNNLETNEIVPDFIMGDMDSISPDLKDKYSDIIISMSDQAENDLRKAINWAEENNVTKAAILGAFGKRDDHSLANIFTLLQHPSKLDLTIYTDYGIFSVVKGEQKFDSFKGQQVSLFSAGQNIEITSTYLKYNLNNKRLSNLYCGSLNESLNEVFTISVSHGQILVYQVFE